MKYRVLQGLSYLYRGSEHRAEPGDVVELPKKSVKWLIDLGAIEPVEDEG